MHHTGIGFIEVMKSVNTIYIGEIRIIDFPSYQYCLLVNALKRDDHTISAIRRELECKFSLLFVL